MGGEDGDDGRSPARDDRPGDRHVKRESRQVAHHLGPIDPGQGPLEREDLSEMVVGGRVEMEGEAHGPKQVRELLGPDRPDLNPHQASGVTPAAVRACWTSVSKPVAEVV